MSFSGSFLVPKSNAPPRAKSKQIFEREWLLAKEWEKKLDETNCLTVETAERSKATATASCVSARSMGDEIFVATTTKAAAAVVGRGFALKFAEIFPAGKCQ